MNAVHTDPTGQPVYFYRVTQLVCLTHEIHPVLPPPYYHDFTGDDLLACRTAAYQYCLKLMVDLENTRKFQFDGQDELYYLETDASISLLVSLVEYYNEENFNCYPLNANNPRLRKQSMVKEFQVLVPLSLSA